MSYGSQSDFDLMSSLVSPAQKSILGYMPSSNLGLGRPSYLGFNSNSIGNSSNSNVGLDKPGSGFWGSDSIIGSGFTGANGGNTNWLKDFMANYGDAAKFGVGAAMGIGNIYTSLSQLGLAKDQFKFTKGMAEKNLANQTQAYNSELHNRERSRLGASGYSREEQDRLINDYVERNKLK